MQKSANSICLRLFVKMAKVYLAMISYQSSFYNYNIILNRYRLHILSCILYTGLMYVLYIIEQDIHKYSLWLTKRRDQMGWNFVWTIMGSLDVLKAKNLDFLICFHRHWATPGPSASNVYYLFLFPTLLTN